MNITSACISWIKNYFDSTHGKKAIIGISGGKDSTVAAALCCKAIGNENVIGVLMPNGEQCDIEDSKTVCKLLNIETIDFNISKIYQDFDFLLSEFTKLNLNKYPQAYTNLPPRIRTTVLYTIAQCIEGCRVCNTSNKCELFVGWGTFGADTFGDFSPLGNLLVSEIYDIGMDLGLPFDLVHKTPADGLTNKSDEDNLGVKYSEIETFIKGDFESLSENAFNIINKRHQLNQFKSEIINVPKFDFSGLVK